ncbi:hypothetical protein K504DRAFT_203742 [Pleomassaria siparia CBS 279.74]|uniref:CFEM domain-containing protein n=1 Tax=Pleomassaria siparia CBS 279.74 TaxID=1314801 RepID=A0A6G1KJ24_9PLEO|nr:hypothetical protein K504DRAFT_203742 [Pleomassaria siparia CBS 279.74]
MKFSFSAIAFAASIAFVNAQDVTGIPTCALTCFATAVPAAGCSLTDTKCQCTTGKDSITASLTSCVPGKCSADDIAKINPAVEAICANAGVTLSNLPTAASSGASAASTASRTASVTGTKSSTSTSSATGAVQSSGAAVANVANVGVMAMGFAAYWL